MSIRVKFIAIFLTIAVSITAVAALFFVNTKESLKNFRIDEVNTIADLKKDKIDSFFSARETDLKSFQNFFMVKRYLPVISRYSDDMTSHAYIDAKKQLDARLRSFLDLGYTDVILTDSVGKMVYATNEAHQNEHLGKYLHELKPGAFERGSKGVYFSDIFANASDDNNISMISVAPLHDFDGRFIGVVALDKKMDEFYASLQDATGLGRTGETLICKKAGNEILVLNPLLHDPDAALKRKIGMGSNIALPLQLAVQGENGAGVTLDYRGKEVVAAWRHIPSLDWGLVVKIDASETFLPMRRLEHLAMVLGVIIIATGVFAMFVTTRYITKPIIDLKRGTEIIGSGNLDHKVGTSANDEIGQLSRAFDRMTTSLKSVTASRDDLRDSQNRLKSIIDNIPDMAWLKNVESRFEAVNESFGKRCGLNPEDIIGKSDHEIWPAELASKYVADDKETIKSGRQKVVEERIIGKDGLSIWVETIKSPIYNDNGELLGTVGIARDISERKNLEQKKADFYAMVTHDIKSPLASMLGYSELILEDMSGKLDPQTKEMVQAVVKSGNRLSGMVEDFLSISRLEAGGLVHQPVPSDIKQIVRDVCKGMENDIRKKGLDMHLRISDGLPATVMIDAKLIQRAVANLVQNAFNYTPTGGVVMLAVDRVENGGHDEIVVSVSDNGPGIAAEELSMVFEKYYRSPKTTGIRGTGLGLAIVKAVAVAHGGRVELESEPGRGSTFRLYLPVSQTQCN